MTSTAEKPERLEDGRTASSATIDSLIRDIYRDDSIARLTKKTIDACILDEDNMITCGTLAAYEGAKGPITRPKEGRNACVIDEDGMEACGPIVRD